MSNYLKQSLTILLILSQLAAASSYAIVLPDIPAPASPVPLEEQRRPMNDRYVPLQPTRIGDVIVPAIQYAAVYHYPGYGDIKYSRIDIFTRSDKEVQAVLQFADSLSHRSDHTEVLNFVSKGTTGESENKQFVSMMPVDLRRDIHRIDMPKNLMNRAAKITLQNFDSARNQILGNKYDQYVRLGKTGEYKRWFSIWRFSGNTVGSFLSVVAKGATMASKVGYGIATGAMSAALMYYNNLYMRWLTNHEFADWAQFKTRKFWDWLGIPQRQVLSFGDEASAITKWNSLELAFMAMQALMLKLMGIPMATTPRGYLAKGSVGMILGFVAQYPWDKANSELWAEYNRYVTDKDDRAFYETYSALKMVLVSWGQVTALSVAYVYPRIGYSLLLIMAVMGFAFRRVADQTPPQDLITNFTGSAFRY